jgi:uncharacterized protein with von Willebrand factor type A (vWA) domain
MAERDENLKNVEYLKRFLDRKTSDEQHRTAVVHDKLDRRHMDKAMEELEQFRDMEHNLADAFGDQGGPLTSDIFHALNKSLPVLRDEDEMRPDSLLPRETIKEMLALREYEELHDYTTGDPIAAALAGTTMEPKVTEIMTRLKERQDQINEMLDRLESQDPEDGDPLTDEELQNLVEQLGEDLSGMRSDLREAMKDATEDLAGMEGMSRLWGTDPGELKRMPAEDRIRLAKRLRNNPNLHRLAELIGAFTAFAFAMQHQKTDALQTDIYDIEMGNDLNHVLPGEFGLLNNPITKMEFKRRYAERSLMQYRLHGREMVGKGGIVCCIDTSGSMGLERDVFAKAVGLSLLRIAQSQNRSFFGVLFGSRNELKGWDLSNARAEDVLDFASFSFHGGTDFEAPLGMAMDYLTAEHDADGAMKSDIVFITDGYCGVSDGFMKNLTDFKERLGTRIFGVSIGGDALGEPLKTICDGRVWPVSKLNSAEDVKDVFTGI